MAIDLHICGATMEEVLRQVEYLARHTCQQTTGPDDVQTKRGPAVGATEKPAKNSKKSEKAEPKNAGEQIADELDGAGEQSPAEVTLDDVKRTVREFLSTFDNNAEGQKEAKAILNDAFSVAKVADLKEKDYPAAAAAFKKATQARQDDV